VSDSSQGSIVGGVIGAVIGGYFGGPSGAQAGFALGAGLGGAAAAEDQTVTGPRRDDLAVQASAYGKPIPVYYGTARGAGNVIWLENNALKETRHEEEVGGKGGPSTTKETFTYSATFAVSLCEGPIGAVRRIWADAVLIYDRGDTTASVDKLLAGANLVGEGVADEGSRYGRMVLYRGTDTQDPDPRMEADRGVGNVPAYRGLAYLLVEDLQLEDFGNRIPSISAEVVSPTGAVNAGIAELYAKELAWPGVNGNALDEAADWLRLEQDTVIVNIDPGDSRPALGDGANAVDYRYTPSMQLVSRAANAHLDVRNFPSGNYPVESGLYIGSVGGWQVHVNKEGARVVVPSGVDGSLLRRWERSDVAADRVGASITPDGASLFIWYSYSGDRHDYERYEDPLGSPVETGTMDWTGRYIAANGTGANAAAVESDLQRVWVGHGFGNTLHLMERQAGGDYAEVATTSYGGTNDICLIADKSVCWVLYRDSAHAFTTALVTRTSQSLQSIVADQCVRAGLAAGDIDATALSATVRGYPVSRVTAARSVLGQLRSVFPFDAVQRGYTLTFVPRGGAAVATLTDADLGAHEPGQEAPAVVGATRRQESDLPRRVRLRYTDFDTDYEPGSQYAARQATTSQGKRQLDVPVVLTATEAAQAVDVILRDAWSNQEELAAATSWQRLALEPADVVTLDTERVTGTARITRIDDGRPGLRELVLAPDGAGVYASSAEGLAGEAPGDTLGPTGPTELALLDLPAMRDRDDSAGFYAAMSAVLSGWRGAQLYMSPAGTAYASIASTPESAVIGRATTALADGPTTIWDRGNSVNVELVSGTLSAKTEREILDGANVLAIASGSGWEIVQFADATLEADGTYTLATLLRGRKGTEWATAGHAADDRVVLLTGSGVLRVERSADTIGDERFYKPVSAGRLVDPVAAEAFTYAGVNLKPYSPVHVAGTRAANDDLTITWTRRARIAGAWRDYVGVPLVEDSESYEIDVMDGATVVRTLTASTPSVTYTAAQQTSDFGSAQSAVTVRVYQMSATVGRGYQAEATV